MDPVMNISEMRVLLRGVVKIFEAGLQSKMWDIYGMPHFVTTTHCEDVICVKLTLYTL